MRTVKNQNGVGLIEVLIAIVVLSVGFLAAAKMQIQGMRYSQSAYFLSQANFMLRDMTDRMRANRVGVLSGHYNNIATIDGTVLPTCVNASEECNPQQIAQADLHAWSVYLYEPNNSTDFKPLLPSTDSITAEGRVDYDAATAVYTLSVSWAEQSDTGIAERELSVQLTP